MGVIYFEEVSPFKSFLYDKSFLDGNQGGVLKFPLENLVIISLGANNDQIDLPSLNFAYTLNFSF